MKIRTLDGDFNIVMKGTLKSPYPPLKRTVSLDGEVADAVAVTEQITCEKDGKIYKGYHAYILKCEGVDNDV